MAAGLDQLFRAYWKLVHGYLTRRTGDAVLAEARRRLTSSTGSHA